MQPHDPAPALTLTPLLSSSLTRLLLLTILLLLLLLTSSPPPPPLLRLCRCNLLILAIVFWVFVVGIVCMCLSYAMPVTGAVRSLDGTKEYAPHGEARGVRTVHFEPNDKDKRKEEYAACDAKTKLDAFVGVSISAVAASIADVLEG